VLPPRVFRPRRPAPGLSSHSVCSTAELLVLTLRDRMGPWTSGVGGGAGAVLYVVEKPVELCSRAMSGQKQQCRPHAIVVSCCFGWLGCSKCGRRLFRV
jgi:hypothetical protein